MNGDRVREIATELDGLADAEAFSRLCTYSATGLPVSGSGISLIIDDQHSGCLGASNDVARQIEELQFRLGEGPCLEAHRSGEAVIEPDLSRTDRWPQFTRDALASGVGAIYALPMRIGTASFGALDVYRDSPGLLTPQMLADAQQYADLATALVLDLRAGASEGVSALLDELFENRLVIHQATGMVAVQLDTSVTEALVAIRAHAYASDRPVADIARAIVDRTLRLDP